MVIDALGSPPLAQELIQAIGRITSQPIRHLVVTHYHADHVYGLQAFQAAGATITAHRSGQAYLHSDTAALRLQASRQELAPWIDDQTRLVAADRWIDGPTSFTLGGVDFLLQPVGPAHTLEDLVVFLPQSRSPVRRRHRLPRPHPVRRPGRQRALDRGAGPARRLRRQAHRARPRAGLRHAQSDLKLTRDYLQHLRQTMGEAARNLEPFEEAYAKADWSRFEHLPLFKAANRINAYNTYLLMEQSAK